MSDRSAVAQEKAATLVEALPWLARLHGRTVVVKYGGHAMAEGSLRAAFAEDVVFLRYCGINVVVVHGGGPQISEQLDRMGVPSRFEAGLRVTSPEAMDVVRMVLVGRVNRDVVGLINGHGPFAVGMSGEDANLFTAVPYRPLVGGRQVDLGQVGEIVDVQPAALVQLLADRRIPVVASIARGARGSVGEVYNVNADTAAAALAVALGAEKLVVLTDVEGLYADWPANTELVSSLPVVDLEPLVPDLSEGMVPKMQACLTAVRGGVARAHVLDGRVPHALLVELLTDAGVGTMVVP